MLQQNYMRGLFYLLFIVNFMHGCQNQNTKPILDAGKGQATIISPMDMAQMLLLDSIDSVNHAMVIQAGDDVQRMEVDEEGMLGLYANIKKDHRIFGFEHPDTLSQRVILFSIFTNDVKDNPFRCRYGAYYQTSGMEDLNLKYLGKYQDYIMAGVIKRNEAIDTIYFQQSWVNLPW